MMERVLIQSKRLAAGASKRRRAPHDLLQRLLSSTSSTTTTSTTSAAVNGWKQMGLDNTLLTNLKNLNFQEPTAVQRLALPIILHKRKDIIAAAETGSGKTLAFGLPLVQMISWIPQARRKSESLSALILCPTRELALQVQAHIDAVAANTTVTKDP